MRGGRKSERIMTIVKTCRLGIVTVLGLLPSWVVAGPDHIEGPLDAGSTRTGAQTIYKNSPSLRQIFGELDLLRSGVDSEDMYLFRILDAEQFSARTDGVDGSFAMFDSQLWLFRLDTMNPNNAFGLLGNNNSGPLTMGSLIRGPATDLTAQDIPGPGDYLIAITAAGRVPVSAGGPIFQFGSPTEISGPDGPGGLQPHTDWVGEGSGKGTYMIAMTGSAGFCPPTGCPALPPYGVVFAGAMLCAAGVGIVGYRKAQRGV